MTPNVLLTMWCPHDSGAADVVLVNLDKKSSFKGLEVLFTEFLV